MTLDLTRPIWYRETQQPLPATFRPVAVYNKVPEPVLVVEMPEGYHEIPVSELENVAEKAYSLWLDTKLCPAAPDYEIEYHPSAPVWRGVFKRRQWYHVDSDTRFAWFATSCVEHFGPGEPILVRYTGPRSTLSKKFRVV